MASDLHQISLLSRQAKQGCGLQMKLGCFGGSVTASEEFHLALKQRSRVILPFSSALLNWDSPLLREFSFRGEGVFAEIHPAVKSVFVDPSCGKGDFEALSNWSCGGLLLVAK